MSLNYGDQTRNKSMIGNSIVNQTDLHQIRLTGKHRIDQTGGHIMLERSPEPEEP